MARELDIADQGFQIGKFTGDTQIKDEARTPSLDIIIAGAVNCEDILPMFGFNANLDQFKKFWWDSNGAPFTERNHKLKLDSKFKDCLTVIVKDTEAAPKSFLEMREATMNRIEIEFGHGHTVLLSAHLTGQCKTAETGKLHGVQKDDVFLSIKESSLVSGEGGDE